MRYLAAVIFGMTVSLGTVASAGIVMTSATPGGSSTDASASVWNFGSDSLGNGSQTFSAAGVNAQLSFGGNSGIVNGSQIGQYAAPWAGQNNLVTANYAAANTGAATLTFSTPQTYFGLLWGSVDAYNSLSFYDAQNHLIGSFGGTDVTKTASGDESWRGSYYVNFSSDVPFAKVVASSDSASFEFDDVAFDPLAGTGSTALAVAGANPVAQAGTTSSMLEGSGTLGEGTLTNFSGGLVVANSGLSSIQVGADVLLPNPGLWSSVEAGGVFDFDSLGFRSVMYGAGTIGLAFRPGQADAPALPEPASLALFGGAIGTLTRLRRK